jgi:hypothetical protein
MGDVLSGVTLTFSLSADQKTVTITTSGPWRPRRVSAWILKSHIRMMPEKGSKGNLDPSRVTAPGDAGTPVAGRDGPAVLPGSAGDGSWRSAVAEAGLGPGRWDCNNAARGHSADRSRTPRGIHRRGKAEARA